MAYLPDPQTIGTQLMIEIQRGSTTIICTAPVFKLKIGFHPISIDLGRGRFENFRYNPMFSLNILPWPVNQWARYNQASKSFAHETMNSTETIINTCNAMLRGELSAIEAYTQVIEKFSPDVENGTLEGIRADHLANAESLRRLVGKFGEKPATSSGPWGSFATTVEGVANLFGESTALMALQQGEEHGIRSYKKALDDDALSETVKDLIRDTLLPAQRQHLVELELCRPARDGR